jgi:hypothetical protein
MAVLTKKRYRVVGDFSLRERGGEQHEQREHHFVSGDELPVELADSLSRGELAALTGIGKLVEIGKPPAPKQVVAAPKPPTPSEILGNYGLSTDGPRGVKLRELNHQPTANDLAPCAAASSETTVVVHRLPDGTAVATLGLSRLMALYVSQQIGPGG